MGVQLAHVLFKTEYLQPVYINNPFSRPIPAAVKWKCIRRVCLFRPHPFNFAVPRAPFYPHAPARSCETSQHLSAAGREWRACLFPQTPNSCIESAPVVAANLQKLLGVTSNSAKTNIHLSEGCSTGINCFTVADYLRVCLTNAPAWR